MAQFCAGSPAQLSTGRVAQLAPVRRLNLLRSGGSNRAGILRLETMNRIRDFAEKYYADHGFSPSTTMISYLKANSGRISGTISTTTKDYIINYQDLPGYRARPAKLALPTLIALCSVLYWRPRTLGSLAVLGEISISGTLIKWTNWQMMLSGMPRQRAAEACTDTEHNPLQTL